MPNGGIGARSTCPECLAELYPGMQPHEPWCTVEKKTTMKKKSAVDKKRKVDVALGKISDPNLQLILRFIISELDHLKKQL